MNHLDSTPEHVRAAMTYGVCRECGAPRGIETETQEIAETGLLGGKPTMHRQEIVTSRKLVCPNGHPQ